VSLAPRGLGVAVASAARVLSLLASEYRRAIAAERRYDELRRTNARRVFAEMYSAREGR
jgi:hypothetical protein